MRTRIISTATALAVLFSSAALVALASGPAAADSDKRLDIRSAGDVLVDGEHQRVYVSDPRGGKIVVTDYAGTVKATLDGLPDVEGLALSPDSGQVYAAVAGLNRIVSVETTSYSQTASYALDGAEKPRTLALASGKLWFGYGASAEGGIGSLDLSGGEPVITLDLDGAADFYAAPELGSDPDSGILVAGEKATSSDALTVYDVSGPKPELRVTKSVEGGFFDDIAVSPDGTQIVTASGAPYYHPVYSTKDLSPLGRYDSGDYGSAVDIAPDGTVAAGTFSWYRPDVHIYRQGKWSKVREYDFPNTAQGSGGDTLAEGGLAWAPDGSRLFAVSSNSDDVFSLRILTDPAKSLPTLTVEAPEKAPRARALTVEGKLTGTGLPAGTELTVTRTDVESPDGKALPPVKTEADGSFSFTDSPPAGGKVTYKVAYAGDATHAAASASDSVEVSRTKTTLTLDKNGKVFGYGADVAFTAHLGSTYKNRTVEIWADPYGADKPNKLVERGVVNSRGDLRATVDMKRDTKVTAVFSGDARSASAKATSTAYAKVKISSSVSKHYRTGKIGSTTYHYFHKNTDPVLATTMSYYKDRKQRLEIQVYGPDRKWHSTGSDYFKLGTNGKSTVRLEAPGESGIRARIRSSYVNGTSGDNVNSTTHGAWKYLNFTR
ncbi:YncE family protein [Streptomyces alboniger]|uniref:WD40 repeat domain-containing protein n=1 Tax=Streptomyces alboniger TaxID=132473 RepID=A0A5J6HQ39_STRAD|nr:WD40 repeat domain-containing protein [Streptomyces alboniger]QEV22376.1 WD40 repeat domain-containing protein [Streptomyces alboniger]